MKGFAKFLQGKIDQYTSRKFLLTLAGILVLVANQQWTELVILISGYTGVEGVSDIVGRFSTNKYVAPEVKKVEALNTAMASDADDAVNRSATPVPGGFDTLGEQ